MIKADAKIIEKNLRRLNEFNSTPEFGTTRVLFTETELAGREFVKGIMKDNGLEVTEDAAGNIFGKLAGLKKEPEKEIPEIVDNLEKMKIFREDLWMSEAKPFGYELMDVKLGSVITRLNSTIRRIKKYLY